MSEHYPCVYRKDTGEIVQTGMFSCDDDFVDMNFAARINFYGGETHDVIDTAADPNTQYVASLNGEPILTSRPILRVSVTKTTLLADGTDTIVLSGLPAPCEVVQDPGEPEEERITVQGGGFVFSAETPGKYQFRIERFPFLPLNLEFTAT